MKAPALDALVEALRAEFPESGNGNGNSGRSIASVLASYARSEDDWRALALFSPTCYTRNLVVRDPHFELMVLAWSAGQESPIHNHEGQDCWMAVLEGRIEEVRYPVPAPNHRGPLTASDSKVFGVGEVAFIRDEIGLHLVRGASSEESAVSLHLYAAPYDACNVYCPETGRITRTPLQNHSERGRVLASSPGRPTS